MSRPRVETTTVPVLICLFIASCLPAFSQSPRSPVDIRDVDGSLVDTPVYSVQGSQTSGRADDWFRAYMEYDTSVEWLDELTVTFYVRVKGKSRDVPPYSVFKGSTTYIHIPEGKRHMAEMYIHPNIIKRFGDVDAIAVEVSVGGRLVGRTGKPRPNEAWWERFSPTTGVLLNVTQTPFAFINLDQQQIIKPAER